MIRSFPPSDVGLDAFELAVGGRKTRAIPSGADSSRA